MKDEEIKFEEIEVSHTLGGSGEVGRGEGRGNCVDSICYHCVSVIIPQFIITNKTKARRGGGKVSVS